MKKKISRDIVLFIILIPLFLWGAFYISSRMENRLPAYSVINKSGTGCSVFYEALGELGYPVQRTLKALNLHETDTIQIAAGYNGFDVESIEVRDWVKAGGTLVYLSQGPFDSISYGKPGEGGVSISVYEYGNGKVIACEGIKIVNRTLTKDTQAAYDLVGEISKVEGKQIYFNETHLFSSVDKPNLWDVTPLGVKFIIYQILIILIALLYYKGKKFGKAIPLYDEVERTENEYLYAASSLYRQAKCWDLMLESYYRGFLKEIRQSHESWIEYWEKEDFPSRERAKRVYEFMNREQSKLKSKECMEIIGFIEGLRSMVRKRRDSKWKTLKGAQ